MTDTVYHEEYYEIIGEPPAPTSRALAIAGDAYTGASRTNKQIAMWSPTVRSADRDIDDAKELSDKRGIDAYRNDAYMMGGVNYSVDSIVGAMFLLNSKPEFTVLGKGFDDVWAEEFQEEVEAKFTLWGESTENWPDASRVNTFTSFIRLGVGIEQLAGELLASVEWLRDGARPYNTAFQMIDLARLSNPMNQMNDKFLRNGVLHNGFGAPMGYHIRMAHPQDYYDPDAWQWKYVPIRKPWGRLQMIHVYKQNRAAQSRGISDLVASLKEHRMTKNFRDIVLQNAIMNASIAASIESELPPDAVYQALGGVGGGKVQESIASYATGFLGAIQEYSGKSDNLMIDGVRIPHLFPGTKLQLRPAGKADALGNDFENSLLRYISANLGISYEEFSNDYSKSNYSSIRAAMGKTWKTSSARKRMVADRLATSMYRCWLEEAINKNDITTFPKKKASMWYEGLNSEALSSCEWVGASRGQIDELKETQAAVLRIDNNLSTHEAELGRLGKDYRKVFRQKAREKKMQIDSGIYVDPGASQNMKNAVAGGSNPNASQPDSADKEETTNE